MKLPIENLNETEARQAFAIQMRHPKQTRDTAETKAGRSRDTGETEEEQIRDNSGINPKKEPKQNASPNVNVHFFAHLFGPKPPEKSHLSAFNEVFF